MLALLQQVIRLIGFIFLALVGLAMAMLFIVSTIIAVAILTVTARLRGTSFSAKDYWVARKARRKPLFGQKSFSKKDSGDVTDVKARDIH